MLTPEQIVAYRERSTRRTRFEIEHNLHAVPAKPHCPVPSMIPRIAHPLDALANARANNGDRTYFPLYREPVPTGRR
jgi:hypothetical protein